MSKKTPEFDSLLEAYELATGKKVKKSKGIINYISFVEQERRWEKKQEALAKEKSAD